NYGRSS
ncbi:tryptophan--tRNA ligase, partial [Chlamydia psittaci 84-8471/1]